MKITDERISYLSRAFAAALTQNNLLAGTTEDAAFKEIQRGFILYVQKEAIIDRKVRAKIESLSRGVPEGSSEWDILYRQYYNEELVKI